jgi:perosamine synthetase
MSNVQAAIGCGQMERIKELITRKREIFAYYRERLKGLRGAHLNAEAESTTIGAWMPTVVFNYDAGVTRESMQGAFAAANIDARVFFHPLSSLPMFEPLRGNAVAWDIPERAINLPSYHDLTRDEQDRIVATLISVVSGKA